MNKFREDDDIIIIQIENPGKELKDNNKRQEYAGAIAKAIMTTSPIAFAAAN